MNEIDLFLNLLDGKAAEKLLEKFNENVKSNNLQLKKIKLMKIFRGLYNNRKKSNSSMNMNPFDFAIYQYVNPKFKNLSEYELFQLFSKDFDCIIPDYIKFSNSLYYYTKKTKEKLDKIIENYKNGEILFKGTMKFTSDEEVEKFLLEDDTDSIKIKNTIIKNILKELDEKSILQLDELKKIIEQWSLVDYQNKFIEQSEKYPVYLIQLEYLRKHENKTEIENGIALDMLFNYYSEKINSLSENYNEKNKNDLTNKIKDLNYELDILKKENDNLQQQNTQLIKNKKQINKEQSQNKKDIDKIQSKIHEYEEMIKKENIQKKELKNEINELEKSVNNLTIKNKDIKRNYELLEKENTRLLLDNNKLNTKVEYIDAYFEYACSTIESEEIDYLFAIINTIEIRICKSLFPEILFIDSNNLHEKLYKKEILKNINRIYIQRNGLPSSNINLIEKFAKQNDIKTKIIVPRNEKEMIEEIVRIKNNI